MRLLLPILLIIVSIFAFITWTNPLLAEINALQVRSESLDTALENSRKLDAVWDDILTRYQTFDQQDINKLEKMVPNSVDNIGLVFEIDRLAAQYGILIENAQFDPVSEDEDADTPAATQSRRPQVADSSLYEAFDLEFAVQGSYANFVAFLEKLEKSLRLVDIRSITFNSSANATQSVSDVYRYNFTLTTYRLRN
jgi:Tfp pilus assembly protein PilO